MPGEKMERLKMARAIECGDPERKQSNGFEVTVAPPLSWTSAAEAIVRMFVALTPLVAVPAPSSSRDQVQAQAQGISDS